MNLNLSDEQASLLAQELTNIIDNDRYFLSPRIHTVALLKRIDGEEIMGRLFFGRDRSRAKSILSDA